MLTSDATGKNNFCLPVLKELVGSMVSVQYRAGRGSKTYTGRLLRPGPSYLRVEYENGSVYRIRRTEIVDIREVKM